MIGYFYVHLFILFIYVYEVQRQTNIIKIVNKEYVNNNLNNSRCHRTNYGEKR